MSGGRTIDNNVRLACLLNYVQSSIIKRFIHDVCVSDSYKAAVLNLPYFQPKEGSMFTYALDVAEMVRAIWETRESCLNYDYLILGALMHEYKLFDDKLPEKLALYMRDNSVCENAIVMLVNVVTAPKEEDENILTCKTPESVIIRHTAKAARVIAVCGKASAAKDGQRYIIDYIPVPVLTKPINVK